MPGVEGLVEAGVGRDGHRSGAELTVGQPGAAHRHARRRGSARPTGRRARRWGGPSRKPRMTAAIQPAPPGHGLLGVVGEVEGREVVVHVQHGSQRRPGAGHGLSEQQRAGGGDQDRPEQLGGAGRRRAPGPAPGRSRRRAPRGSGGGRAPGSRGRAAPTTWWRRRPRPRRRPRRGRGRRRGSGCARRRAAPRACACPRGCRWRCRAGCWRPGSRRRAHRCRRRRRGPPTPTSCVCT